MDKNTWIGFLLIAAIIVGFTLLSNNKKSAKQQQVTNTTAIVQQTEAAAQRNSDSISAQLALPQPKIQEEFVTLENEKLRLTFSTLGGRIYSAQLKEYKAYGDSLNDLTLFQGDEANMSFTFMTVNNHLTTKNLHFVPQPIITTDSTQTLVMRLETTEEDSYMDFVYTLPKDEYMFGFSIVPHNMQNFIANNVNYMEMHWNQLIPQQERGRKFEERYAQLQYMLPGGEMDKLSEQKYDKKTENANVRWIAYKDQFFSTVLIADNAFSGSIFESTPQDKYGSYIKEYNTTANISLDIMNNNPISFRFYIGPNKYNTLKAYDADLEGDAKLHLKELVPLGWKIVAWINKILVIPMFDLFTRWGLHIGIIILLMTFVIKLILLPFVFASYKSSAKMRVLKPQIDEINAKYPADKMQERQQATMALYQRAGVSPMSGCLPMLFQFPVLMAMFWFFPTAIELRGQSFLWAEDLSTYDAILTWSHHIPLLGTHLSLFCLLMTVANFGYTFITMQNQASDPNMKIMKWMMYLMPVMFLFIFNDYAAGLSYYYLLSLGFTILQTMIFRWSVDDAKLLKQMEENAKKKGAQKKSGFMARLEKMQQEQLRAAREQAKANAKRMR
ncbi:MAG: membrane protein insertase YidC [Paludibacteraceae bacterium]|nr:membrane protein insertase YidC [Paludibacteraceae bacterium]